jgi:ATP-dependent RNA helicase DDX19/DBP5
MSVVVEMGKFTTVTTGYAIKETPASQNAHIVIGTAGTLLDQLSKGIIDPRKLKVFVLDEADNMLEKGTLGDQTLRVKKLVSIPILEFMLTFRSVAFRRPFKLSSSQRRFPVMCAVLPPNLRHVRTRSC